MLYEFRVFKEMGNKRKKIFGMEVSAANPINALEKACIRFDRDRVVEIRQVERIDRPKISRIERNGVI